VHSVSKKQTRSVLLTTAQDKRCLSQALAHFYQYKQHWLTVLAREKRPCYPEANDLVA